MLNTVTTVVVAMLGVHIIAKFAFFALPYRRRRAALDKIVRDNEPFIQSVVNELKARGLASPAESVAELSDDVLLNAGREGYAEALKHFKPESGALPPYAKRWIMNKVARSAAANSTIHKPEQIRLPAKALRAMDSIYTLTGRQATAEEIGIDPARLAAWRSQPTVVSMEEVSHGIAGWDHYTSDEPNPEETLALKELATVVEGLPGRQREVVRLLFWGYKDPEEVAEELDLTVDAVLELRDEALAELHACLS